jgi:hypothetical protein
MRSPYNRPTKYLPVRVPKDHHVGPKALPVRPSGPSGGPSGPSRRPRDHPAKKISEPDPPPAREQPQVQANGESLFTEMPTKGSPRRALESS